MQAGKLIVTFAAVLLALSQRVEATPISVTDTVLGFADASSSPPNPFTITFSGLPTDSAAGGILTLETFGDFDTLDEYIDITIDGVSFGRLWDNDTANDPFTGTVTDNDNGQQYGSNGTNPSATLVLTELQLDAFLVDGMVQIGFTFSPTVDNLNAPTAPNEFITATLEFDFFEPSSIPAAPEPSSLVIFGFGACLIRAVGRRRRNKRTIAC